MSNETKIGLLAIFSVVLSIWGYQFLKGRNIISPATQFYVEYPQVDQLTVSSPVLFRGFQVGIVKDIYMKPDDVNKIIVVLSLEKDIRIPKNALAEIGSAGIMGGKVIHLNFDKVCQSDCAESGDYLHGSTQSFIQGMVGNPDDLDAYFDKLQIGLGGFVDSLSAKVGDPNNKSGIGETMRDLQVIAHNLKNTTTNLDILLASSSGNLNSTLKSMDAISGNLENENEHISNILGNADSLSASLREIDLEKTLKKATNAMNDLSKTMSSADKTLASLNEILTDIKAGKGTIGKMMQDETLHNQLLATMKSLDSLVTDFQTRPYRYMPLKSKRKVEKYDKQNN